jgi:hypothetical protein
VHGFNVVQFRVSKNVYILSCRLQLNESVYASEFQKTHIVGPERDLNFWYSFMEVIQTPCGTDHDLQPQSPGKGRMGSVEQVVIQALVGHEFVDQQPVLACF